MGMEVKRFDVFLIALDPTRGHEIKKNKAMSHYFTKRNEPFHIHCYCCSDDN